MESPQRWQLSCGTILAIRAHRLYNGKFLQGRALKSPFTKVAANLLVTDA